MIMWNYSASFNNILEVYSWADVVYLPSHSECAPYAALEAQALGVACVMPALGAAMEPDGMPSLATFAPGDGTAAAREIDHLLSRRFGPGAGGSNSTTQEQWEIAVKDCYEIGRR